MHDPEKSHSAVVAVKPPNKVGSPAAEAVEPRAGTKGNADQQSTHRTQTRTRVTQALNRVRQAARQRKKEKFTALFHHVSIDHLEEAFFELKENAAPGADGLTCRDYEQHLERNLEDLHARVHRGAYRALPRGAFTYPSRMVGSARSRSPPLRTRSSRGPRLRC